jgi:energy-coupling factor transport system permease protein
MSDAMTQNVLEARDALQERGWLHRTDPRVKVIFLVLFTLLNLLFLEPAALIVLTISLIPIYLTTRVNYRLLGALIFGYSFFLLAIIASQGMAPVGRMAEDPENLHYVFDLGFIHMTWEGLGIGVARSFRFANPFFFGILVALTTDPVLMTRGLIKMRLPFELAFMVLAGLRFLPLVAEEASNISEAQTVPVVRGRVRRFKTSLFPLFLNSLKRAQRMGVTIEAKSFGARNWNTFLRDVKFKRVDLILLTYALVLFVTGLYVRFVIGWGYASGVANPY